MTLTSKEISEMDIDMLKITLEDLESLPKSRDEIEKVYISDSIKLINKRINELENKTPEITASVSRLATPVMDRKEVKNSIGSVVTSPNKSIISF